MEYVWVVIIVLCAIVMVISRYLELKEQRKYNRFCMENRENMIQFGKELKAANMYEGSPSHKRRVNRDE